MFYYQYTALANLSYILGRPSRRPLLCLFLEVTPLEIPLPPRVQCPRLRTSRTQGGYLLEKTFETRWWAM